MNVALRSLRELIRHVVLLLGLEPKGRAFQTGSLAQRFEGIYARGDWAIGEDTPLSGTGSSLSATAELRRRLPELLVKLEAQTLLDIGCGDFTWMRELDLPCKYVGIDIVAGIIQANISAFSGPQHRFLVVNAVSEALPAGDIGLCREVLFHLSFADATALLKNIASNCRWLLLTTDKATWFNSDIESGGARFLNLEASPFLLGPPEYSIEEPGSHRARRIGAWSATRVAQALEARNDN